MGFDKAIVTPKKESVSSRVITDRKVKKTPSLKLMTKNEIEKKRVSSYEFAI